MKSIISILMGIMLISAGCTQYSTFREVRPSYHSSTPAGQIIARSLKNPSAQPLAEMGSYLDAASAASSVLKIRPTDIQAQVDYNFAVARVFGIIHDSALEPWKSPLLCPGVGKVWNFSMKGGQRPERNPTNFSIQPADVFKFKGTLVRHTLKDGIGAPLVLTSRNINPLKIDPFAQGKHIHYGMTGVVDFNGPFCVAKLMDPLASETVTFEGHTYPIAADFTASVALALANLKPKAKEFEGLFRPEQFKSKIRLARLQPYDPAKIPVLCIHGLGDSQATWAPLIQTLRGDPFIRKNYQFWFFSYPTGYPYPLTASVLRKQMDEIGAYYPDHKKILVIGHSMGGMITRTLITDSGMNLWHAIYDKPPGQMPFSAETRQVMGDALIFKHRNDVSRVIFASPSHRGSYDATNFMGRLGSKIIGAPTDIMANASEALTMAKPLSTGDQIRKMPNSVDILDPKNRFVTTMAKIPTTPDIPFHTIIGDRGKGGNLNMTPPVSTDGIVPYWSSHLDGAQSEIIIPSDHWTHRHPLGMAEIARILHEHLKQR